MGNNWPQEKLEKLIELFGSNLSCGKIAVQLDTTRNAIIGKLSRLGLSNPKPTITFRTPPKPVETPKRRARIRISEIMPDIRTVEINSRGLSLLDLGPDDCRWPFGDHDFTFCGHPRVEGSPYCLDHFYLSLRGELKLSEAEHERRRRQFQKMNTYPAEAAE